MSERNKIATQLSREELEEFVRRCETTPNLTLKRIAEMAAEHGLKISLKSAKAFRDTTFERVRSEWYERLAKAERFAGIWPAKTTEHFLEAAKALLAKRVFGRLV